MKISPTTTATTIIPPIQTSLKLFFTGATVGPLVDSVHNQSLLRYDRAPIQIPMPTVLLPSTTTTTSIGGPLGGPLGGGEMNIMHVATSNAIANFDSVSSSSSSSPLLFSSSWYIPPLLGIAYVVLGGILPRIMSILVDWISSKNNDVIQKEKDMKNDDILTNNAKFQLNLFQYRIQSNTINDNMEKDSSSSSSLSINNQNLQTRAILAVTSTIAIIKLSDILQTHPSISTSIQQTLLQQASSLSSSLSSSDTIISNLSQISNETINLSIMITAAILQWIVLDGTTPAFLTALLVSIGGPLSEIPFVWGGFWHYISSASDYLPLQSFILDGVDIDMDMDMDNIAMVWNEKLRNVALSSITGPCYAAVTMDSIALGRWFDSTTTTSIDDDSDYE